METMLSGIKPTGRLTLGNYIGAIREFVKYQDEYEMFIFIANQHALTVPISARELRQNTKDLIAFYLAAGLDPNKVTLFLQSDVPAHSQVGWIMTCLSGFGELSRMTQFKDKMQKKEEGVTAGLYAYPALMAADILLYDADYVPVGVDQSQHVELARDLAQRFNSRYSPTFKLPKPLVTKVGAKIYDLQQPTKKMSKSESSPKGVIDLLDDPAQARNKIKGAVTDSIGIIQYDPENQPGIANLLTIYSALADKSIEEALEEFEGADYKTLKEKVGDTVYDFLSDLQKRYHQILDDKVIDQVLEEGAAKANAIANKKVSKVYRKMGLNR